MDQNIQVSVTTKHEYDAYILCALYLASGGIPK